MKKRLLSIGISLALLGCLVACSTGWIQQAEAIVNEVAPAVVGIIEVINTLQGHPLTAQQNAQIQSALKQESGDLALVNQLLTQYQAADKTARPGILGQITSAITTANSDISPILAAIHVENPAVQQRVTAMVNLVAQELTAVEGLLPTTTATTAQRASVLTAAQFKAQWNALVSSPTSDFTLNSALRKAVLR